MGPPLKENSDVSDDDSQGTCSRLVALLTPAWVLRNACSALTLGVRISSSSSVTNRLWSFRLLLTTEPTAAE